MARTREFDTDAAVERAMDVFWSRGYAATSIQDLVEATGVGRGSLYAAFGSKEGLYEAALLRYAARSGADRTRRLTRVAPVREVLRDLLVAIVDATVLDPERRGCLITNAATERLPGDAAAARVVGDSLDRLSREVAALLRDSGRLAPGADAGALADLVVTVVQGIRVQGKAGADRRRLTSVVDQLISVMPVQD